MTIPEAIVPPTSPAAQPTRHIKGLDSLRGIAAFAVVLHHIGLAYASLNEIDVSRSIFWRILDNWGHSAVIVFFVLSGFVLQISYDRTSDFRYGTYLLKRVARIYPALLVALLVSAALNAIVAPMPSPALGDWLNLFAFARHDLHTILVHLALVVRNPADFALDNPIWSLAYEMRFSLVFPFMAWLMVRRPALFLPILLLVYAGAIGWLWLTHSPQPYILGYSRTRMLVISAMYLLCFGVGMAATRWLLKPRAPLPMKFELVLVAGALAVLSLINGDVVDSVAAVILIACASVPGSLSERLALQRWALWLGRISYSLYVLHVIILFYLVYWLKDHLPFIGIALIVIVAALLAAEVSYRMVEMPGMALGRKMVARWNR